MTEQDQNQQSQKMIPISSDGFVPVKATPQNMRPLMNKMVQQRTDQINARHQHDKNPPKFKTEEEYYRCHTQQKTRLSNGAVVVGNMTEAEKKALESGNEGVVRRVMLLREKAREIMRRTRMEGKSQGAHYQGLTSYEALSKRQGMLPNSPYKDRDGYLEGEQDGER